MGFQKALKTPGTTATHWACFLQSCLLLAGVLFLGGKEEVLAALFERSYMGERPTPLQPQFGFRSGWTQLRKPLGGRSCSTDFLPLKHRLEPSFLSSWTSPSPEIAEASVAGDWDVSGKLQEGAQGGGSRLAAGNVAAGAIRRAAGAKEATAFVSILEALQRGRRLSLSLSTNRVAELSISKKFSLGTGLSVRGIWQGSWLRQVPQLGLGEASLYFSPFFPWRSHPLGAVEIKPHEDDPTVDTLLQ
ncbi:hypothetical protein, conserved [Eimeria maxima]|uniref:Uncharacterized protein n=1 Tax=Eimeria maxima TaxID=5804 RepID=U6LZV9_EIMMA|nr:hypothetical protein, conserved [Eimeria maxima]CDJ57286.1 hypothetical protein, conserved [Eimeria maxima]